MRDVRELFMVGILADEMLEFKAEGSGFRVSDLGCEHV